MRRRAAKPPLPVPPHVCRDRPELVFCPGCYVDRVAERSADFERRNLERLRAEGLRP